MEHHHIPRDDYLQCKHHENIRYLLLVCCWVSQVLARCLDGLGSSCKLCLIHEPWTASHAWWFWHSNQICSLCCSFNQATNRIGHALHCFTKLLIFWLLRMVCNTSHAIPWTFIFIFNHTISWFCDQFINLRKKMEKCLKQYQCNATTTKGIMVLRKYIITR